MSNNTAMIAWVNSIQILKRQTLFSGVVSGIYVADNIYESI